MASMTKLRRRMQRWSRYADKTCYNPRTTQPWAWQPPRGFQRAARAIERERGRRESGDHWPEGCSCGLDWRQQCSA